MKKLYESYRQTVDDLAAHIARLKNEKEKYLEPEQLNSLNARIELLETERGELIKICAQLRAYMEPKSASPSMAARSQEVDAS